jgi:hypothetical protein
MPLIIVLSLQNGSKRFKGGCTLKREDGEFKRGGCSSAEKLKTTPQYPNPNLSSNLRSGIFAKGLAEFLDQRRRPSIFVIF